ncbi:MAG TPA: NADH-dependent alcohol dehydrogenase [Marinilabiliales bacterium]|nr:MAG: aldehyde reductase [Bacteroidetes bacterium GWA2_40_14]OFX59315.1 MAG: aldehyde reductase [Bacteroidetes bacterium GWC2_40_13]OFX74714.1 MAG: aldehyde reductase [Bacteroidetes bacterium GWD2_40_43]OFX88460.1 MAG: aldehyde reductase [Bacteroidetes bacterium GWE2_40_63]OFY22618.1 MAG: aldehyde reductase [Bacteroidetes bacterium GWF2_40_13]OFZ29568.1 MAG: aldehyde reductase [Bacteroidetes bacterium RIFOXYC2_FULL_40_12]HAN00228.1 NADH-dependent alcohol dehydrogenase [Marinilabiliales bact
MENFNFYNPVKILFGKGKTSELSTLIPANAKVLMTYGGGSIKKNGVYEQVIQQLKPFQVVEFGGIEPNPRYETCMKAVALVKQHDIDFLLAVGGGSVLDGTKFIAAASKYAHGDPWDILSKHVLIQDAVSLGAVLTLPATGSEMNGGAVITKEETQEKLAFVSPLVMPKFSILDPVFTFSLPRHQVANGIVDAFVHVMEQYLTYPVNSPVQDRFAESLLITLIEEGNLAMQQTTPVYENRANLMWAATMALNGIIGAGVKSDWATHTIGHELTAFHGLDHAVTLAIVLPGLLRQVKEKRHEKLSQFAYRVWNIRELDSKKACEMAIDKTEAFFRSLGMLTKLHEHTIHEDTIDKIILRFGQRNMKSVGNQQDISLVEVKMILKSQL